MFLILLRIIKLSYKKNQNQLLVFFFFNYFEFSKEKLFFQKFLWCFKLTNLLLWIWFLDVFLFSWLVSSVQPYYCYWVSSRFLLIFIMSSYLFVIFSLHLILTIFLAEVMNSHKKYSLFFFFFFVILDNFINPITKNRYML